MAHECTFDYLTCAENELGGFFLVFQLPLQPYPSRRYTINYCPICGMGAPTHSEAPSISIMNADNGKPRDSFGKIIEDSKGWHEIIMEIFIEASKIIQMPNLKDYEFEHCKSTIVHTLQYFERKRRAKE